jgi:hypothetical protein
MRNLLVPGLLLSFSVLLSFVGGVGQGRDPDFAPKAVRVPPAATPNAHYVSNRPPLMTSPLVKLPIGAIESRGWLLSQLQMMRNGFTGRLAELSRFLRDDSGWVTNKGQGWEEMPYWLKGHGDLGYLLRDPAMRREAERWLSCVIRSQQPDGYFGPADNKQNHDLWPNMVMLNALQSFYDVTGDRRIISFMSRYFQYEYHTPIDNLLTGSWQKLRGGENLESVYWLYNRTGENFLIDLGRRLFERTADWTSPLLSPERDRHWVESSFYHGVNIAMGFREPAVFYQQARDRKYLEATERNYRQVMDEYGQQPGGMFGADENIRPGKSDPRQGAETCSMVEFMASFESLLKITGDAAWADRCEEVAFNSLPASMTPDLRGLHYLTAPNLISCDSSGEHDFQNGGTLVSYDPWDYRCCQHNVAFGWPYFAEHLWLATADNGLAAVLYAPSTVHAVVGEGTNVGVSEETFYPFGGRVVFTVSTERPVDFPLYFRIPGWATKTRVEVNGLDLEGDYPAGGYAVLKRLWRHGDQVSLEWPMDIRIVTWPRVGNAVSVRRGPLWYSLKIREEWKRYGGTDAWPAYEILPLTPWNYGLVINASNPGATVRLVSAQAPDYQPFRPETAPVVLKAKARRIPGWQAAGRMVGPVPASPVEADGPLEDVELIPMGCARLRISSFPTVKK